MQEITATTTQADFDAICRHLCAEGQARTPDSPALIAAQESYEDNVRWIRRFAVRLDLILGTIQLRTLAMVALATFGPCLDAIVRSDKVRVELAQTEAIALKNPDGDLPQGDTSFRVAERRRSDLLGLNRRAS